MRSGRVFLMVFMLIVSLAVASSATTGATAPVPQLVGTSWMLSTDLVKPPEPSIATTLTFLNESNVRLSGPCGDAMTVFSWAYDTPKRTNAVWTLSASFETPPCDLSQPGAVNHEVVIRLLSEGLVINFSKIESLPYLQLEGLSMYRTSDEALTLLSGTTWQPVSVSGRSVAGTNLSIRFNPNGTAQGQLSCNGFGAYYAVQATRNTVRVLIESTSTAIGCGAEDELAADFSVALSGPSTFTIAGDTLTLVTESRESAKGTISPQTVVLRQPSSAGPAANTHWRHQPSGASIAYGWDGTIRVQTSCSIHEVRADTGTINRTSGTCHKADKLVASLASADSKTVSPIVWPIGNAVLVRSDLPIGQLSGTGWKIDSGTIRFTENGRLPRKGGACDWVYREIRPGVLGVDHTNRRAVCTKQPDPLPARNFRVERNGKKELLSFSTSIEPRRLHGTLKRDCMKT